MTATVRHGAVRPELARRLDLAAGLTAARDVILAHRELWPARRTCVDVQLGHLHGTERATDVAQALGAAGLTCELRDVVDGQLTQLAWTVAPGVELHATTDPATARAALAAATA